MPCPPDRRIARDAAPGKTPLRWSTAYPDGQLQSPNALAGPASYPFADGTGPPVILNGRFTVTNSTAVPVQMYRLKK